MNKRENEREQELKLIRQAKNEYMKIWRAKNPDKAKKNSDNYWLKRAKEMQQSE